MSTLQVDRRGELRGRPGLHAFVVGVSAYPKLPPFRDRALPHHLDLTQVPGPALSAWNIANAIKMLPVEGGRWRRELKTLRLMVLPDENDIAAEPDLASHGTEEPTHEAFRLAAHDWRDDASDNPDSMALFYFAGHGLLDDQSQTLMALADIGSGRSPSFSGCASVFNLHEGMKPSRRREDIAREQFFFIDSCRLRPHALEDYKLTTAPDVFALELDRKENRSTAPIYYAARAGSAALTRVGQLTHFGEALLSALPIAAVDAADDPCDPQQKCWPVTALPLAEAIAQHQRLIGHNLPIETEGVVGDGTLLLLRAPPLVDVEISVTGVDLVPHMLHFEEPPPGHGRHFLLITPPPPQRKQIPVGVWTWCVRDVAGAPLRYGTESFHVRRKVLKVRV